MEDAACPAKPLLGLRRGAKVDGLVSVAVHADRHPSVDQPIDWQRYRIFEDLRRNSDAVWGMLIAILCGESSPDAFALVLRSM